MKIEFLHHTKEMHKLVEMIARVCYQSYGKVGDTSHTMLRGIMGKGHLSVASVGSMVFEVKEIENFGQLTSLYGDVVTFKEINNYIRWSFPSNMHDSNRVLISMNILTLLDLVNNYDNYHTDNDHPSALLPMIVEAVKQVPYLYWFIDSTTHVEPSEQPYMAQPDWLNPVILAEDYTHLKALGLSEYELGIHATITVDLVTDRSTGLQMWRHADQTGGCELSQRYVDRANASFRMPIGLEALDGKPDEDGNEASWTGWYDESMKAQISLYKETFDSLVGFGMNQLRAKEIARNLLPNIQTRILQCRPLRQWKHYISLRTTPHAQAEIQADTKALVSAFAVAGIEL